jgi:hypothetical protein
MAAKEGREVTGATMTLGHRAGASPRFVLPIVFTPSTSLSELSSLSPPPAPLPPPSPMLRRWTLALAGAAPTASAAAAYSWDFAQVPTQCGTLALNITGSGGKPPFKALIAPYGNSPLSVEVRRLFEVQFNDSTSLSVPFRFPANSQFVVTVRASPGGYGTLTDPRRVQVSDANGFGTGGASAPNTVQKSNDDSCFDKTQNVAPAPFGFNIAPANQLIQCGPTRLFWLPANVTGLVFAHASARGSR